jgi:hypothetical protein
MSEFFDLRLPFPCRDGFVFRRDESGVWTNVPHLVTHHSPTGFEWGYSGSGPADLALNIVEFVLRSSGYSGSTDRLWRGECFSLAYALHQDFKRQFIATLSRDGGFLSYADVVAWVKEGIVSDE